MNETAYRAILRRLGVEPVPATAPPEALSMRGAETIPELPRAIPGPLEPERHEPPPWAPLLALPLPDFAKAGQSLEVRVAWWPEPLWFVPDESAAEGLVAEGISRGVIWTARELLDLLALSPTPETAQTIARARAAFDGEILDLQPATPQLADAEGAWPREIAGLGSKRIGPLGYCANCRVGSWVAYGDRVYCLACARRRAAEVSQR
ncbi:MAG: hypothetical protein HY002_06710 [Candidatus Rokubacteria bacterium]|nr:hypothetical protein [Candidatus Rokubacteria bacterium]